MASILVTGSKGQLGSEIQKIGFTILDDVFYTDREELDITDYAAVESFVKKNEIDTIINCAAYTAVDLAEDEVEKAELINTKAVANLANVAAEEDCLLIHISTDYVFDGASSEPYTEKVKAAPLSVYGKTKLAGEKEILKSGCWYIIIRTAWLYSTYGNNFVKTILRLAGERQEINVVNDQIGSPTYAADLAKTIISIMDFDERIEHEGIYHYTDEGTCSWYDFAKEIVRLSGKDCQVNPISTTEYPTRAPRPAYSVLDKTKIKRTFAVAVPDWKTSLAEMINSMNLK